MPGAGYPRPRSPDCRCTSAPCSTWPTSTTTTISSERLAELAGVNAAKVRKDLSYLGSYGTRGVGYDVEFLLFQMSRELGLTQDWPVVIVGIGNLGHALANYGGFSDRGFPVAALVDVDPAKVGSLGRADVRSDTSTICPTWSTISAPPSASSPRPAAAAQDVADRLVDAGVTSILNFAPALITRPRRHLGAQGRPGRRAADPQLLPAAPRRPSPTSPATARDRSPERADRGERKYRHERRAAVRE